MKLSYFLLFSTLVLLLQSQIWQSFSKILALENRTITLEHKLDSISKKPDVLGDMLKDPMYKHRLIYMINSYSKKTSKNDTSSIRR